jgi:hypothetical protein
MRPKSYKSKIVPRGQVVTDVEKGQTLNTERTKPMSKQKENVTEATNQQETGKKQPLHKETHGAVQVTVWDNGPNREPTVSFGRRYRGPQGWKTAQSYHAKDLSDLMKATEGAAQALGKDLEPRTQESGKGKLQEVCAIDSGRFTALVGARWNATAEAYTYAAKILCDGKQVFASMLNHELAGLQRIAKEEGVAWLGSAVSKQQLPEPSTKDFRDFDKTLEKSQAIIGRFMNSDHQKVLADKKVAEELGLDLSGISEQKNETAHERAR